MTNFADYQPGGNAYNMIVAQWGSAAAQAVAAAAASQDVTVLNAALSQAKRGETITGQQNGGTSTFDNFVQQVTTDPLGAPLASLNSQLWTGLKDLFKNPLVLLALAVLIFGWLGGFGWLRKRFG